MAAGGTTPLFTYTAVSSSSFTPSFTVNYDSLGVTLGTYYVGLVVDNKCCGSSIPIWQQITVAEPEQLGAIDDVETVCGGNPTLSVTTPHDVAANYHYDWYSQDWSGSEYHSEWYLTTGLDCLRDTIVTEGTFYVRARLGSDSSRCYAASQTAHINIKKIETPTITPDTVTIYCGTTVTLTANPCADNGGQLPYYQWCSRSGQCSEYNAEPERSLTIENLITDTTLYVTAYTLGNPNTGVWSCVSLSDSVHVRLRDIPGPYEHYSYVTMYPGTDDWYNEERTEICQYDYIEIEGTALSLYEWGYEEEWTGPRETDQEVPSIAWFDENGQRVNIQDMEHSFHYYGEEQGPHTFYAYAVSDVMLPEGDFDVTYTPNTQGQSTSFRGEFFEVSAQQQLMVDSISVNVKYVQEERDYDVQVLWREGSSRNNDAVLLDRSYWTGSTVTTVHLTEGYTGTLRLPLSTTLEMMRGETYSFYVVSPEIMIEGFMPESGYERNVLSYSRHLTLYPGAATVTLNDDAFPSSADLEHLNRNGYYVGTVWYHLTGDFQIGCISSAYDSITIVVDTPSVWPTLITASADTICLGDPVTLTANGTLGSHAHYEWFLNGQQLDGETNTIEVYPSDTMEEYSVRIVTQYCGESDFVTKKIRVNRNPGAKIADDIILCHGQSLDVMLGPEIIYEGPNHYSTQKWLIRDYSERETALWDTLAPELADSVLFAMSGKQVRYFVDLSAVCNAFHGASNIVRLQVDSLPRIEPIIDPGVLCHGNSLDLTNMTPTVYYNTVRDNPDEFVLRKEWRGIISGVGQSISDNTTYRHEDENVIYYEAENVCGVTKSNFDTLRVARIPILTEDAVALGNQAFGEICEGSELPMRNLAPAYIADFENTGGVSDVTKGWRKSETETGDYGTDFISTDAIDYDVISYWYRYFVTNGCGTDTSNAVQVFVSAPPVVDGMTISSKIFCLNDTVTFDAPAITDVRCNRPANYTSDFCNGIAVQGWNWNRAGENELYDTLIALPQVANYNDWNGTILQYFAANVCDTTWSDPIQIYVHKEHELHIDAPDGEFICPDHNFRLVAVSSNDGTVFEWSYDAYAGTSDNDQAEITCDWRYTAAGYHTYTVTATGTDNMACQETVSKEIRVYEHPQRVHTRVGLCNPGDTFYFEANHRTYYAPTKDTVSIPFANNDACDSVTHFLTITDGEPFIQLDDNELRAGVGQTMSTGFIFGSDCYDNPEKISLAYQLYKDGEPVEYVNQYGSLNITTTLPRLHTDFSTNIAEGHGEIPGNTFALEYYNYNYFYTDFAAQLTNSVTGVWNEEGIYTVVFTLYGRVAGQDYPSTYLPDRPMGGAGSRIERLIATDSVVMVVGTPQLIVDTATPVVHYHGDLDIDTVNFTEEMNETNSFDIDVVGATGNAPTKLAIDYEVKRNGVVLGNMATFGSLRVETEVPRLNRTFGKNLTNGTGSIPDNTFSILYYNYDYFYNHFIESTHSHFTAQWFMPGEYEVTFTLRERTEGQDIPISYSNDNTLYIGGHGSSNGPVVATQTLIFHVAADTVEITENVSVCENDLPYLFNGHPFDQSGEYIFGDDGHIHDTLLTLTLTVLPVPDTVELAQTICKNELPYQYENGAISTVIEAGTTDTVYSFTLAAANGCDSVVTLQLTINPVPDTVHIEPAEHVCDRYEWEGEPYTESGVYPRTYMAANGCDSVVMLHLTVGYSTSTFTEVTWCGSSYEWNNTVYDESGIKTVGSTNNDGCPHTDTLSLTLLTVPEPVELTATLCENDLPYRYENGAIDTVFETGTANLSVATFHLAAANGCDSVVTLQLTINSVPAPVELSATICENDLPYQYVNGIIDTVFEAGTPNLSVFTFNLAAANGCDSVVTLQLTINQPTVGDTTAVACGSFEWYGETLTTSGNYPHTFIGGNAVGCDSTVTLHLTVNAIPEPDAFAATICENDLPYHYMNGRIDTVFEVGTAANLAVFTFELSAANGCPVTDTLRLMVNRSYNDTVSMTKSVVELPYSWNGYTLTNSDTVTAYLHSVNGCDSTVTLQLAVTGMPDDGTPFMVTSTNDAGDTITLTAFANNTDLGDKLSVDFQLYKDGVLVRDVLYECGGSFIIGTEFQGRYVGTEQTEPTGDIPFSTFFISNYHYEYFYWAFFNGRENRITHNFTQEGDYKLVFQMMREEGGQDYAIPYDEDYTHRIGGKLSRPTAAIGEPVEVTFHVNASDDTPATIDGPKMELSATTSNGSTPVYMTFNANGSGTEKVAIRYNVYRDGSETPLNMLSSYGTLRVATEYNNAEYGDVLTSGTGFIPEATFHPSLRYYNYFYMAFLESTRNVITANWTSAGTYRIVFELVQMTGGQDLPLVSNGQRLGGRTAQFADVIYDTKELTYTAGTTAQNPSATAIADADGDAESISLYPNPARNTVFVKLPSNAVNAGSGNELQLFDLYGQRLRVVAITGEVTEIDLSGCASGMYLVKLVRNGEVTAVAKVVKQQ